MVDGLQRLSTIFQLAGILKNEDGSSVEPLTLESTTYLPSLGGKRWEGPDTKLSLTTPQRLIIKRTKIDVSILLRESSETTKYELFQRLNTGGSPLSDQEVRNSILIMLNREMYRWIRNLAEDENFIECIAPSDRALEEQYDMELVLRFLVFRELPESEMSSLGDLGDFLTDKMIEFANRPKYNYKVEERAFRTTFQILQEQASSDSFRRYDPKKNRFSGGFSVSSFEAVALGVGYNFERIKAAPDGLLGKIKNLWSDDKFINNSGSGIRASSRIPKVVPFARKLFVP